ncbi:membrane integrity-associated transporter subunit PqiC [Candidatus Sodalis endolongispinus]|uniref:Membrane integrity-associated transporter subunit PqiC n=1 Tax=Candidatus Sodalis endolongispinus TaxID=2812662 RepID=A0ABS5YEE1_9GAMM|nr:membrane integrity-associated transporter subunit PqiC [Candidatus Sodalis endolongispinus]MBT9433317.1 membrane integrity-associated transporter subunit PqiC [Candidatus Sodalis endolongispinus]
MLKGKLLALATVLLLGAYAGGNTYYQLPYKASTTAATLTSIEAGATASGAGGVTDVQSGAATPFRAESAGVHPKLWVEQVSVADFLAGNGLVYQTSDVQYTTARSNLWASPLEQQLQQALVANLSAALPVTLVSTQPIGSRDDGSELTVTLTGFHGRYDGRAVVQGVWLLTQNGRVIRQPFDLALPQEKDGYDALVRTLAQGWDKVGQQVAKGFIVISK